MLAKWERRGLCQDTLVTMGLESTPQSCPRGGRVWRNRGGHGGLQGYEDWTERGAPGRECERTVTPSIRITEDSGGLDLPTVTERQAAQVSVLDVRPMPWGLLHLPFVRKGWGVFIVGPVS